MSPLAQGTRLDEDKAHACALVLWLYEQAKVYRRLAPGLVDDIARFEDAAALLDTYQAGLALATPHALTGAELIRWVNVQDARPDSGRTVLMWIDEAQTVWPGYHHRGHWYDRESVRPFDLGTVSHWAELPTGPAPIPSLAARHEPAACLEDAS